MDSSQSFIWKALGGSPSQSFHRLQTLAAFLTGTSAQQVREGG